MVDEWYASLSGRQVGPLSTQQLRDLAATGQLQPNDPVWKDGMADWQPANTIQGLPLGAPSPFSRQPSYSAETARPSAPPSKRSAPRNTARASQGAASAVNYPAPVPTQPRPTVTRSTVPVHSSSKPLVFDGGAGDLWYRLLLAYLLCFVTLGLAVPWIVCMYQRWKARHTLLQGRRLKFTGTGLGLFGRYLAGVFLCVITLGIYVFWFIPRLQKWSIDHIEFADAA